MPADRSRAEVGTWVWQLALVLTVSAVYESAFLHYGLSLYDEGWPLYAAMRLHGGGTLYRDTMFLFPPGHVLPAWIAYALDPPGLLVARIIYAGFNVALCGAIYVLGRRLMPPAFALLGALLVATAAMRSHWWHLLFGYRYLVFSVLALLAFSARLRTGESRWMVAAGASAGLALCFRLTPAFAVVAAIAVATLAAQRDWRSGFRDGGWFTLGFLIPLVPVMVWLFASVDGEILWREIVTRIVGLQGAQSVALPEIVFPPEGGREALYRAFIAMQFRLIPVLYAAYIVALSARWVRCRRQNREFGDALLLAVAIWGLLYFVRAIGRSDDHHLNSAIPPACLLIAHLISLGFRALWGREAGPRWERAAMQGVICVLVLAAWLYLGAVDVFAAARYGTLVAYRSIAGGFYAHSERAADSLDGPVEFVRARTAPGDTILDLTMSPFLYVAAGRRGPGYLDIIMPGTFLSADEERAFVERLEASPPALVIWPLGAFDGLPTRALSVTAPRLAEWVKANYRSESVAHRDILVFQGSRPPS